jgi:acetyltransferase-like isoleucine patch superfamily enzyme
MLKRIESILRGILVWKKYRSIRFSSVGSGCFYQSLSSTFLCANKISMGANVNIGPRALLDATGGICLGDGCILAPEVMVFSRSHNFDQDVQALPFDNVVLVAPVHIGRYVWIGTRAIILPGVSIGDGAVIGAGAVVAKDVPSFAVAVGNPARVVRFRDRGRFEELAQESTPFVFQKFGHGKVLRAKSQLDLSTQTQTQDDSL